MSYVIKKVDEEELQYYMKQSGINNRLAAKVFLNRNYGEDFIKEIINSPESFYRNPKDIYGAEEVAKRIIRHIVKPRNKIYIFGDYDVDGITSIVLLKIFLESFGLKTEFDLRLPERREGYGLNLNYCQDVIDDSYYNHEDKLVITVDNGVACKEQVEFLQNYGIETVVIDHHNPQKETIPDTLICNPHMESFEKEEYEGKHLAGVAVVYKVCQCINMLADQKRRINLNDFLPFVAMGTISDMMVLNPENMAIVINGLKELKEPREENRFKELFHVIDKHIGQKKILYTHIAWDIAPKINACGRIDTPVTGAKLFLSYYDSSESIKNVMEEINEINQLRKKKSAEANIEVKKNYDFTEETICCCKLKSAPEGILGQIATEISDREKKPSFVLKKNKEGMLAGSGRSPYDITGILLEEKGDTVHFFAGHKGAFGIQIYPNKLDEFRNNVTNKIKALGLKPEKEIISIDSFIELEDITLKNYYDVNLIPMKTADEPIFAIRNLNIIEYVPSKNKPENIKFFFSNGRINTQIWGWNIKDKLQNLRSFKNVTLVGKFTTDFQNPNRATLKIIDITNDELS